MKYILTEDDFLTGLSISQQKGGLWDDMRGIELYEKGVYPSGVGVLKPGWPGASLGTVNGLIKRWAKYNDGSNQYNFGVADEYAYRIKDPFVFTELSTESGADKGCAKCEISGTDYIYVATSSNLARITTLTGTMVWDNNSDSYYGDFNNSGGHPAHTMDDVTWWGDGNEVAKLEADGTFTANALDLPDDYTIVSISEYDKYLAILAVRGLDALTQESRIFFWDMSSTTWNFDRVIPKIISGLDNHGGILYALSVFFDFTIYYYTGSVFKRIDYYRGRGVKSSASYLDRDMFDLSDETFNFIAELTDSDEEEDQIDVYSWGNNFNRSDIPKVVNKPCLVDSGSGTIGSITTGYAGYRIVAYNDGTNDKLVGFYTGEQTGAFANTIDLDAYFAGRITGEGYGRKKTINWIRVDFQPLASGDLMTLKYAKDYSRTFANICDTTAGSQAGYTADGAVTSKTFNQNFNIGDFRHLKLQFYFNTGNVRIHKVVIDWDYADETGR